MFSIIVPIYNSEKFLGKCLKSIKNQSFLDFEVILINDGSTDSSEIIMNEYISMDKRFKKYNFENEGLSVARNRGIRLANKEYILFVDSDDTLNVDLLFELNKNILTTKVDLVRFGVKIIDSNEKRPFKFNEKPIKKPISGDEALYLFSENQITYALPWVYAIKRDLLIEKKLYFTPNRIHEDFLLMPFIVGNAKSLLIIEYVGYNYLIRENSISATSKDSRDKIINNYQHFLKSYNDILNNIDNLKLSDKTKQKFLNDLERRMIKLSNKVFKIINDKETPKVK